MAYRLPSSFEQDRVFVEPVTTDGRRLRFLTDTGGGDWVYEHEVRRLRLQPVPASSGEEWAHVPMPRFRADAWVPAPRADGRIMVNPTEPSADRRGMPQLGRSGMLGQQWFGDRIWEIDYRARLLVLHGAAPAGFPGTAIPLGFPVRDDGQRGFHFPRIGVEVDGEGLDLLLDTGASTRLSPAAAARLGVTEPVRATSFVIESVAQRWRDRHPDWPVIEGGEGWSGRAMIRVPSVLVGGMPTGPVWFTLRADRDFTEYMSQWMDRTVVGALGGNALRAFRMLLDYPAARAVLAPY